MSKDSIIESLRLHKELSTINEARDYSDLPLLQAFIKKDFKELEELVSRINLYADGSRDLYQLLFSSKRYLFGTAKDARESERNMQAQDNLANRDDSYYRATKQVNGEDYEPPTPEEVVKYYEDNYDTIAKRLKVDWKLVDDKAKAIDAKKKSLMNEKVKVFTRLPDEESFTTQDEAEAYINLYKKYKAASKNGINIFRNAKPSDFDKLSKNLTTYMKEAIYSVYNLNGQSMENKLARQMVDSMTFSIKVNGDVDKDTKSIVIFSHKTCMLEYTFKEPTDEDIDNLTDEDQPDYKAIKKNVYKEFKAVFRALDKAGIFVGIYKDKQPLHIPIAINSLLRTLANNSTSFYKLVKSRIFSYFDGESILWLDENLDKIREELGEYE